MPYTATTPSLPFQSQSDTSRDAAIRAQSFAGKQAATVLGWFAIRGAQGGTQRECSEQCGYARASVAARVNALERAGLLVKTSERREHCAVYRSAS
jgi:hypothetical protein